MKLIQLQFLVGLKKYGSFSRTAQKMYISQPVISVAIKTLEEELGRPLLERSNKGVTFTPFGELVLEQAQIIEQAVNQIRSICSQEDTGIYGTMTVASLPHLCNTLLLDIQLDLAAEYPNLHLQLESSRCEEIVRSIERNEWNLGIIQTFDIDYHFLEKKLQQGELFYQHLFQDKILFVAGEKHPLCGKKDIELEELLQYPYLSYSEKVSPQIEKLFETYHYDKDIICIREFVRMRKYASIYQAVTCLPEQALIHGNLNYRDKLVPLDVKDFHWNTSVGILSRKKEYNEAEKMVVKLLKEECHGLGLV